MLVKERVNKLAPKLKDISKNAIKHFSKNKTTRLYLTNNCTSEVERISSEVKESFNKISSMPQESISAALKKFDEVSQVLEHSQTPTVNKELDKNEEKENINSISADTNDEDSSSDEKSQAEGKEDSASNKITNIMIGIAVGVITTGVCSYTCPKRKRPTRTALTGPAQNSANNIKESLLDNPKLFSEWWKAKNRTEI